MISHDVLNDFSDWTKTTTNLHLLSIVPRWNFNPFICAVPRLEVSPNCSSIAHVSPLKMEIFPPLSWRFVSVVPGNDDQGQSPGGFAPAHSVGQSPKRCVYLCDSMCVYIIYYHPGVDKIWCSKTFPFNWWILFLFISMSYCDCICIFKASPRKGRTVWYNF